MTGLAGIDESSACFEDWQRRVAGTNISAKTLLATDYLNHFNEIIMLLGMVADMPELLEDCRFWQPKSYPDHFRESGFSDRELAIAAYAHVPDRYLRPFEETIEQMNAVVETALVLCEGAAGEPPVLADKAQTAVSVLQKLQDHASAIIHGSEHTMNQAEIDRLLGL